jgi:hypothetical protein
MGNHYHLVVETPRPNLSLSVRQLNGVYSQSFNRRHGRVGHLFQGRFGSQLVGSNEYFLAACRYVILNPVRGGLCARPEDWEWSSFSATIGLSSAPSWLNVCAFLGKIDSKDPVLARRTFRFFVREGTNLEKVDIAKNAPVFASEEFIRDLQPRLETKRVDREFPRRDRLVDRPSLDVIFDDVDGKSDRDSRIHLSHVKWGYTMKGIAEFLSIHYVTVSRAVKKMS